MNRIDEMDSMFAVCKAIVEMIRNEKKRGEKR